MALGRKFPLLTEERFSGMGYLRPYISAEGVFSFLASTSGGFVRGYSLYSSSLPSPWKEFLKKSRSYTYRMALYGPKLSYCDKERVPMLPLLPKLPFR
jgi:hypothetical protein